MEEIRVQSRYRRYWGYPKERLFPNIGDVIYHEGRAYEVLNLQALSKDRYRNPEYLCECRETTDWKQWGSFEALEYDHWRNEYERNVISPLALEAGLILGKVTFIMGAMEIPEGMEAIFPKGEILIDETTDEVHSLFILSGDTIWWLSKSDQPQDGATNIGDYYGTCCPYSLVKEYVETYLGKKKELEVIEAVRSLEEMKKAVVLRSQLSRFKQI